MIDSIGLKWCGICNAAPSEGELEIELDNGERTTIGACIECVKKIPKEDWIE
jgi:hypothetical protein